MKRYITLICALALVAAGCGSRADTVAHNLSTQADNFNVPRVISFYNGITGQNMLVIKGLCSIGNANSQDAPQNGGTMTATISRTSWVCRTTSRTWCSNRSA